jgi:SAM-dependent methyltransferase
VPGGTHPQTGRRQEKLVNRWQESDRPRGADYDRRFDDLAAAGMDMHGEVALVASYAPTSVLDAGCGTGRVAIELSRRGYDVMGVDLDEGMLQSARTKAPELTWVCGDLADPGLDFEQSFDLIVMAGNVLIFVTPGTEGQVMENAARWLRPGGRLITGYSITPGATATAIRFEPSQHDRLATNSGLVLQNRWSTWDKEPYAPGDSYAVAVHRREK